MPGGLTRPADTLEVWVTKILAGISSPLSLIYIIIPILGLALRPADTEQQTFTLYTNFKFHIEFASNHKMFSSV